MTVRYLMALSLCTCMIAGAVPAWAQDLDTTQMQQHADTIRQGILVDKTVRRGNTGKPAMTYEAKRERAKATCANKGRAAALHGRNDPKVSQLYDLCAQLGF